MLKHALLAITVAASPLSAAASTHLTEQWGERATNLHDQTMSLLYEIDAGLVPNLSDDYLIEIERFALTADRLGNWVQASGKSAEYVCLFRHLSQTGISQLDILDAGASQLETQRALTELALMFAHAERLASASSRASRLSVSQSANVQTSCS